LPAPASVAPSADAQAHRTGDATWLASALADARAQTLRQFDALQAVLPPGMPVRYAPELNPPRWELGHVAWFEERWLARHAQRLHGAAAAAESPLAASLLPRADRWYDSSRVAHTTRWHLDLPDERRTQRYAEQVRDQTLALLDGLPSALRADDDALYFFRWSLAHEDMHAEAGAYMAQHLALPVGASLRCAGPGGVGPTGDIACPGGEHVLGHGGPGFVFDNEAGAHAVRLAPFAIDRTPINWARYLPFISEGGYDHEAWWTPQGWAWRQRHSTGRPHHLVHQDGLWLRAAFGEWLPVQPDEPAMHLTLHEAAAWCRWAGRRLPTEAEWECAALTAGAAFRWGDVWEWTASAFAPFPGFTPHPYRDYSAPWFDGRPVLKGASHCTQPRLRHPKYRNFFEAGRSDVPAGFRTCAC